MERNCKRCGKVFEAKVGHHIYCSDYCRTHAKIRWETCPICGKTFKSRKAKACSPECSYTLSVMHRKQEICGGERKVDMTKYHSETLDHKAKEWGHKYGEHQVRETLAMVPKIDVKGYMKTLKKTPRP